jgi:exosortase
MSDGVDRNDAGSGIFWHPLWVLVVGYWVWLIAACAKDWAEVADYNHGWFVPPLALYFLWKRVEGWKGLRDEGTKGRRDEGEKGPRGEGGLWLAWGVIGVSLLFILPLEMVRQAPLHWRLYPWLIGLLAAGNTWAVAWLTGGRAAWRLVSMPTLFMLVGIPWPTVVENLVSLPLMGWVTQWSVGLLHMLGYPATATGNVIVLPNCTVGVEEACSGLRSLQTALLVGVAAGELAQLRLWGRWVLLGVSFAMALVANQTRVMMLALAGISGGPQAVENIHDAAGYAVLGVLLGGVAMVTWVMMRVERALGRRP